MNAPARASALFVSAVAIGVACMPACSSADPAAAEPPSALEIDTGIPWNVVMDRHFGTVAFAEPRQQPGPLVLPAGGTPTEAAFLFLDSHREAFSLAAPRSDLVPEAEGTDPLGLRYASFTPKAEAGAASSTRLTVHFDDGGRVAFIAGRYARTSLAPPGAPTKSASRLVLARARPSCFHFDGSGHGVHFYAPPPLRDERDEKHFEVSAGATGGFEMRRDATATRNAVSCTDAVGTLLTSTSLTVWDAEGVDAGAAVDAYYHAGKALEFYRTVLGRASYDDANTPLTVAVHVDDIGAAYTEGHISLGRPRADRPSPSLSYAAAFDAVAHELQHGVTASTLRFADSSSDDDSHAAILDEAVSDMFGAFAEHWLRPGERNLTIGEDVAAPGYAPTRDLAHPSRCLDVGCTDDCAHRACPDHLSKLDLLTDAHRSTGIASNAWALMTVGGTNDTSGVHVDAPLGWDMSLKLWYALVVSRAVPPNARFEDVARATVALARHAGGSTLDASAVACAWVGVGVIDAATAARFWNVRCAAR